MQRLMESSSVGQEAEGMGEKPSGITLDYSFHLKVEETGKAR